jgi:hypothetical protein
MIDRAGRGEVAKPRRRQVLPGAAPPRETRETGAKALRQTLPPRRPKAAQPERLNIFSGADRAIITAGIFTAVASAGFASYMVSTDHSHPVFNGIEHLTIFARPSGGIDRPIEARMQRPSDDQGVDFTATGTIPGEAASSAPPDYVLPALGARDGPVIKGFTLRGVSGNVAMVETAQGIYRVEPGTTLPGAGRVLSVQWRQGKFVVVTTLGVIVE